LNNLKDKVILVSKRILKNGNESFDTYFGKVVSYDDKQMIVLKQNNEKVSIPPYDDELYEVAEEGFYELEDGSTYENPDFIAEFLVHESKEAWEQYHSDKQASNKNEETNNLP